MDRVSTSVRRPILLSHRAYITAGRGVDADQAIADIQATKRGIDEPEVSRMKCLPFALLSLIASPAQRSVQ